MLNRLERMLQNNPQVSAWIINETKKSTTELFFIKDQLDMNRATDIHEFKVKVFTDFEDHKFKGDSSFSVSLSDTDEEIQKKLDQAVYAATFVKNPWYDLSDRNVSTHSLKDNNNISLMKDKFDELYQVLFKKYPYESKVNSCEIFTEEGYKRVKTSKGVDCQYPMNKFSFELVTDHDLGEESVEIFKIYDLPKIDLVRMEEIVNEQLLETQGRSQAKRNKTITTNVILSDSAVEELLFFYLIQASASTMYQKISQVEIGQPFQSKDAKCPIHLTMNPSLETSLHSAPIDEEGTILEKYVMYDQGVPKALRGTARFSHYLGMENKGMARTFEVAPGNESYDSFKAMDHVEILAFSAFLMDPVTGDFGGEFRLAKLVQDGKESFITGGSISANLFKEQNTMTLSSELKNRAFSITPKAILFKEMTVSGE